jgi:hypothetical protein
MIAAKIAVFTSRADGLIVYMKSAQDRFSENGSVPSDGPRAPLSPVRFESVAGTTA